MPLARILTRFPEQAGALSQELRQHGYTVEFSNPEAPGNAPADLEIDFEICAEPDAVGRATQLADQFHADVAISPGVLQEVPMERETPVEVAEPMAFRTDQERISEPTAKPVESTIEELDHVHNPVVEFENRSRFEEQREFQEWSEFQEQSPEPNPLPQNVIPLPADLLAEPALPNHFSTSQAAEAEEKTAFDDEFDLMRAAPDSETHDESATELLTQLGKKSATLSHEAFEAGQQMWHKFQEWTRAGWRIAQRVAEQGREQLNLRREQIKAHRQQKVLEFEKKQALARERAAELEAAREAAAARLQQLLRERGGLTDSQPVPPQKTEAAAPIPPRVTRPEWKAFVPRFTLPFTQTHRPQVEAVATGVAAACALFIVGLAVASFHARPAISGTVATSSSTQPASRGVTVQSGGVTLKPGQAVSAGVTLRPSPAAPITRAQKPTPTQSARGRDVTVRNIAAAHKPTPRRGNSERIGDDVVIRHFGAQVNPPAQSAPRAQLKHYSDLDN
jgi:hypothetical protein